ncbi:MAG: heavy-metal-associated domain-containing protein [Bacteroidota bacterium]|nr:MAG: heavy-metal-associated domain-containing protein [Bacteroidota bacterium]
MKKIFYISILAAFACKNPSPEAKTSEVEAKTAQVEISIEGMTCTGCENTINASLKSIPGVSSVESSHSKGIAKVAFEPEKTDTSAFRHLITEAGYDVVAIQNIE